MTTARLGVELEVSPTPITPANRNQLRIRMTVHNLGSQVIDPQLGLSELRVNGEVAKSWGLALGNSGHPQYWHALPPGERVTWAVQLDEVFPKSGDYTLVLTVSGTTATPVSVHVTR